MSKEAGSEGSPQRIRAFSKSYFDQILLELAQHAKGKARGATLISNHFAKKENVV
jgi:hypothetical protein